MLKQRLRLVNRISAFVLIMSFVIGAIPANILAGIGAEDAVCGDVAKVFTETKAEHTTVQDTQSGILYNNKDRKWTNELEKYAELVNDTDDTFDITLRVEGDKIDPPPRPVYTVLVADLSGSMYKAYRNVSNHTRPEGLPALGYLTTSGGYEYKSNAGHDNSDWLPSYMRVQQVQDAMYEYVNKMLEDPDDKNKIAIAAYANSGTGVVPFTADAKSLKAGINGFYDKDNEGNWKRTIPAEELGTKVTGLWGGLTNHEAGLKAAYNYITEEYKDTNVQKANPVFVIVFMSDGNKNMGGDPAKYVANTIKTSDAPSDITIYGVSLGATVKSENAQTTVSHTETKKEIHTTSTCTPAPDQVEAIADKDLTYSIDSAVAAAITQIYGSIANAVQSPSIGKGSVIKDIISDHFELLGDDDWFVKAELGNIDKDNTDQPITEITTITSNSSIEKGKDGTNDTITWTLPNGVGKDSYAQITVRVKAKNSAYCTSATPEHKNVETNESATLTYNNITEATKAYTAEFPVPYVHVPKADTSGLSIVKEVNTDQFISPDELSNNWTTVKQTFEVNKGSSASVIYRITIKNNNNFPLVGAKITDLLTYDDGELIGGRTVGGTIYNSDFTKSTNVKEDANGSHNVTIGNIKAGETVILYYVVNLSVGSYKNVANLEANLQGVSQKVNENSKPVEVTVTEKPSFKDLTIEKTVVGLDADKIVTNGTNVIYKLAITNPNKDAVSVLLKDIFNEQEHIVEYYTDAALSTKADYDPTTGISVPAESTLELYYNVNVKIKIDKDKAQTGPNVEGSTVVKNEIQMTYVTNPGKPIISEETVNVIPNPKTDVDLTITKTLVNGDEDGKIESGSIATFKIVIYNDGVAKAEHVKLTENFAGGDVEIISVTSLPSREFNDFDETDFTVYGKETLTIIVKTGELKNEVDFINEEDQVKYKELTDKIEKAIKTIEDAEKAKLDTVDSEGEVTEKGLTTLLSEAKAAYDEAVEAFTELQGKAESSALKELNDVIDSLKAKVAKQEEILAEVIAEASKTNETPDVTENDGNENNGIENNGNENNGSENGGDENNGDENNGIENNGDENNGTENGSDEPSDVERNYAAEIAELQDKIDGLKIDLTNAIESYNNLLAGNEELTNATTAMNDAFGAYEKALENYNTNEQKIESTGKELAEHTEALNELEVNGGKNGDNNGGLKYKNEATINYPQITTQPESGDATVIVKPTIKSYLTIDKQVSKDGTDWSKYITLEDGETAYYQVTVTNVGDQEATFNLTDNYFGNGVTSVNINGVPNKISDLKSYPIAAKGDVTFTYSMTVTNDLQKDVRIYNNIATVKYGENIENSSNAVVIVNPLPSAHVTVTKQVAQKAYVDGSDVSKDYEWSKSVNLKSGDVALFKVTLTNSGTAGAVIDLTDVFDEGKISFIDAQQTSNIVIDAGITCEYYYKAKVVNETSSSASYVNVAEISVANDNSNEVTFGSTKDSATVIVDPAEIAIVNVYKQAAKFDSALAYEKHPFIGGTISLDSGSQVLYKITIENKGTVEAVIKNFEDTLTSSATGSQVVAKDMFTDASGAAESYKNIFGENGNITVAPRSYVELYFLTDAIVTTANNPIITLTNAVSAYDDNDEVTVIVYEKAKLEVTKLINNQVTTNANPLQLSSTALRYTVTIRVANVGTHTVSNIVLTDVITSTVGYGDTRNWTIESLAPGESQDFTFELPVYANTTSHSNYAEAIGEYVVGNNEFTVSDSDDAYATWSNRTSGGGEEIPPEGPGGYGGGTTPAGGEGEGEGETVTVEDNATPLAAPNFPTQPTVTVNDEPTPLSEPTIEIIDDIVPLGVEKVNPVTGYSANNPITYAAGIGVILSALALFVINKKEEDEEIAG